MTTRRHDAGRWLVLAGVLSLAVALPAAFAQEPDEPGRLPPVRPERVDPPPPDDPAVEPAQYTRPAGPGTPAALPPAAPGLPPLPPTPAVRLVVLVPQDAPPKANLTYTIRVTNTTTADAHKVTVRMPVPEGAQFVKAEPGPDANNGRAGQPPTEYQWRFKTLGANASQSVQVTVRPGDGARELSARAYVSFEHGQQVVTRIAAPKLKVRTEVPKQAVVGNTVPVRVVVTNEGRVPVENVKLTGQISDGFDFDRDAGGEKTKNPRQRVWEIGTLPPGGARQVAYQVAAKDVRDLVITSVVDGSHEAQVNDEAKVSIKEPKLKVQLKGDGKADAGEPAGYELVVSNTGTLPLTNVRVTAQVPDGCQVRKMTNGGREVRDQITWIIPRLPPDDKPYSVRWSLTSTDSGRKTVRAAAAAAEGVEHAQQVETVFQGAAALHWETTFDQPTVTVDRSGMLTIVVKNTGSEVARNVRVAVAAPKEVSLIKVSPAHSVKVGKLVFEARDLPPGKVAEYSIQFRGEQPGPAYFEATLNADVLGSDPLRTNKSVEIIRGGCALKFGPDTKFGNPPQKEYLPPVSTIRSELRGRWPSDEL